MCAMPVLHRSEASFTKIENGYSTILELHLIDELDWSSHVCTGA